MAIRRTAKMCRECPYKDKCDKKKMELEGYLEPIIHPMTESIPMPDQGNNGHYGRRSFAESL